LGSFQGLPNLPQGGENGGTVTCNDCDPSCDMDGVNTPNQSCTFKLTACVNKADSSCIAGPLKKVKLMVKKGVTGTLTKPNGTDSACGAFTAIVKTKKHGTKAGKTVVKLMVKTTDKRSDKDTLTLVCNSTSTACPTTTTSTVITTTSTTTTVACADCCSGFTMIKTLNGLPDTTINVGSVVDDTGATLLDLKSGGLYFGGAGVGVPLPSLVPNTLDDANGFGGTYTKITACSGGSFTISPTDVTDLSRAVHPNRHCSSARVDNAPITPGRPAASAGLGSPSRTPQARPPARASSTVCRPARRAPGNATARRPSPCRSPLTSISRARPTGSCRARSATEPGRPARPVP